MTVLGIIDYDAGNILSLSGAFDELAAAGGSELAANGCGELSWRMIGSIADLAELVALSGSGVDARLVLPGVGAFGHAMESLRSKGLDSGIRAWLDSGRPFLGICLGLQLLYEGSEESPGVEGIGFLKGNCARFTCDLKIPAIGWNLVQGAPGNGAAAAQGAAGDVLHLFNTPEWYYFVHSYHPPLDSTDVAATTDYGYRFPCAVARGRALAVQFHPEKSSTGGLSLIKGWLSS